MGLGRPENKRSSVSGRYDPFNSLNKQHNNTQKYTYSKYTFKYIFFLSFIVLCRTQIKILYVILPRKVYCLESNILLMVVSYFY